MIILKRKLIRTILLIVTIFALILAGYFYYRLKTIKINPQTVINSEVESVVLKVSKLYLLPVDEEPTVATVSDPEALKDQSFFMWSLKGDKVLIYTKSGKAILYRPSIDKIIEISPIDKSLKR